MTGSLDGDWAKWERAQQQIEALANIVEQFMRENGPVTRTQAYSQSFEYLPGTDPPIPVANSLDHKLRVRIPTPFPILSCMRFAFIRSDLG
jgi:hypothetical protein